MRRLSFAVVAVMIPALALTEAREIPSPAPPGSAQPNLVTAPDGHLYLSWLEPRADSGVRLRFAVRPPPRIGLAFPGSPVEHGAATAVASAP